MEQKRTRISRDDMFCQICEIVAQRSTCLRSQVGAVIVKDGRIVSMGYNGPVAGSPQCTEIPMKYHTNWGQQFYQETFGEDAPIAKDLSKCVESTCEGAGCTRSLHAETNAIAFAARAGLSVERCTMYCTMSPCINCAKVIVNSGIKELVYIHGYRETDGLTLLDIAGVVVRQIEKGG